MGYTLMTISFLAAIVCIIWLVVTLVKKKPKKPSLIGLLVAFFVFMISAATAGSSSPANAQAVSSSLPTSKSATSSQQAVLNTIPAVSSSAPLVSSEKDKATLRKEAKSILYKELARYPDKYKGQTIKFSGEVVQSLDNSGTFTLRVAQDGDYDKMFLVSYIPTNDARILEKDNVTIYGSYAGVQSYQSTLGSTITIPYVVTTDIVIK